MATDTMPLVALVTGGLDEMAVLELEQAFGLQRGAVRQVGRPQPEEDWSTNRLSHGLVFPGNSGVSKLLFEVAWPMDHDKLRRAVRMLKGLQGLLAPVALSTVSLDNDGLQQARAAVSDATCWQRALEAWCILTQRREAGQPLGALAFRASCVRDGPHSFTSVDMSRAVGGAVQTLHGWSPSMRGHELEVVALLTASQLVVGVNVGAGSFEKMKMATEPRPLMPYAAIDARLRSSTASLMLRLARVQPGDVVLDPMCGIGTVPLEASATTGAVLALGGDVDEELVWQASRNARASQLAAAQAAPREPLPLAAAAAALAEEAVRDGLTPPELPEAWHFEQRLYHRLAAGGGAAFCAWSAAQLPLRTGCCDAVVVDLPFGQTHKIKGGGSRNLYPRATLEIARVLRGGGRFVALTPALRVLTDCLETQGELWARTEALQVNCGGILAWVCCWTRSDSAPTATSAGSVPRRSCKPAGPAATNVNLPFAQQGGAPPTSTSAWFYWTRGVTFDMDKAT